MRLVRSLFSGLSSRKSHGRVDVEMMGGGWRTSLHRAYVT